MKNTINNVLIKKILISLLLAVLLTNFVMPNYVQADVGGKLAKPIFQFVAWIGEVAIDYMQKIFMGEGKTDDVGVKYSPGVIFNGDVLAFDINFIKPNEEIIEKKAEYKMIEEIGKASTVDELFNNYSAVVLEKIGGNNNSESNTVKKIDNIKFEENENTLEIDNGEKIYNIKTSFEKKSVNRAVYTGTGKGVITVYYYYATIYEGEQEIAVFNVDNTSNDKAKAEIISEINLKISELSGDNGNNSSVLQQIKDLPQGSVLEPTIVQINGKDIAIRKIKTDKSEFEYSYGIYGIEEQDTIKSTAKELQNNVATWYKALRTFALVGLLSVLVYIGIRIIISSASEDKAKYKKMLSGWVTAVCIVFVLHYIMIFILNISTQITNIFETNVINPDGQDVIMTKLKEKLNKSNDFLDIAGETIMWLVLVIYTGVFSVQYLKRVIYMAFLTMVAPLIALTYPLDKLKDGKAQAFSMWLKEYIFNALLQPVHLFLYYMLVGGALQNLAEGNTLYAIVAIGFLIPAEKFFRKMFGMESQTSVGTIGAAAGGAMVMSMLNKLKGKPPKEEGEKQQKVRTADQNGGKAVEGAGKGVEAGGKGVEGAGKAVKAGSSIPYAGVVFNAVGTGIEVGGKGIQTAGKGMQAAGKGMQAAGKGVQKVSNKSKNLSAKNLQTTKQRNQNSQSKKRTPVKGQKFARGLSAVGDKYIYGKDARKKVWKGARKTITGAAGGLALGTIGLAAGVASGDAGKAFQYAAGGAAAGYIGASNLTENAWSGTKGMASTFKEGYMGTEAYNNSQFDKQFFASDDYKMIEQDPQIAANGIDTRSAVQGYLSQGVTDGTEIRKLLQKNITPEVYEKWADKNMKDPDKIRQLEKAQINPDEYETYVKTAKLRDIDKISDLKENGIFAETYDAFDQIGISNINTIKKYGKDIEKAKQMRTMAKQLKNSDLSQIDSTTGIPLVVKNLAPGANTKDLKEIWNNIQDFM